MFDLHALSSGGSTGGLGAVGTILLGGDGQTVAGVPIQTRPPPTLRMWGAMTTIADTIEQLRLRSKDMIDEQNAQLFNYGASSLLGYQIVHDSLAYRGSARTIDIDQNTGAANAMAFLLDHYRGVPEDRNIARLGKLTGNKIITIQLFASALTAITWGNQALNVTNGLQTQLKQGRYAILGAWINALTNYALLRFSHNSFGKFTPGFPILDKTNTALANAVAVKDDFFNHDGYQFVYLGECPIFDAGPEGTGLTIQAASITADTPRVTLNLAKVG